MNTAKIAKREFIQHTSKYLALCEKAGKVIITHHNQPKLQLMLLKTKTIHDLKGLLKNIKIHGDIHEHVLPGYDEW